MTDERVTYRFGPVERRGIAGQLRAGQVAVVAGGAVIAIGALDRAPTPAGAFAGMAGFGAALALEFAPVARRTAEEWAPVALSFVLRRANGPRRRGHRRCWRHGAPHRATVLRATFRTGCRAACGLGWLRN